MDMKSKAKKDYESPQLTVVSVKAERGYATSGPMFDLSELLFWEEDASNKHMESYTVANDWNEGSNSFWD